MAIDTNEDLGTYAAPVFGYEDDDWRSPERLGCGIRHDDGNVAHALYCWPSSTCGARLLPCDSGPRLLD